MANRLKIQSNESIFNAVRSTMSKEFQDRIPALTKENMAEVGMMLTSPEYETQYNQWQKALINRIGKTIFESYLLQNPLSKYIWGDMSYGDAIEIVAADVIKGRPMDYGREGQSVDPFVKVSNQVNVEFHKIDEPIQYCTTIERDRVKRAFLNEGGLTRLLNLIVNQLYSSANLDTWTLTKNIFGYYVADTKKVSGFPLLTTQKIEYTDVTDEASAKKFLLQVKNTISAMSFPNNAFNPQQIHKTLGNRDVVLFVKADIMNTVGVEAIAAAFNAKELNLDVTIEPMDDFGAGPNGESTDDVAAILAEKDFLLITQQLDDIDSIWNPRGRYTNYFLTRQMSFGCNYFKDAVIWRKNWN